MATACQWASTVCGPGRSRFCAASASAERSSSSNCPHLSGACASRAARIAGPDRSTTVGVFGCIGRDVPSLVAAHSQATMAAAEGKRSVSDCPLMSPPDTVGQPLRVLDHPTTSAKVDELTTPDCMTARPAISATSLSCSVVCTSSWPPPCSLQEPRGGGRDRDQHGHRGHTTARTAVRESSAPLVP